MFPIDVRSDTLIMIAVIASEVAILMGLVEYIAATSSGHLLYCNDTFVVNVLLLNEF